MGIVQSSQGRLEPSSEHLLSEPEIVARLAEATIGDIGNIRWRWLAADYDRLRTWIEAVVPGFDRYNERVREPGRQEMISSGARGCSCASCFESPTPRA